MSEKKQGTLAIVASTGGIKFEGEDTWYNPIKECKEWVKPELKGKQVEISLGQRPNEFVFIKELGNGTGNTVKTNGYVNRNVFIMRQAIAKAVFSGIKVDVSAVTGYETQKKRAMELLKEVEDWVNHKDAGVVEEHVK